MIKDWKKHFTDQQEQSRQDRAEREMERKRTESLKDMVGDETDKLDEILEELVKHRKKNGRIS